MKYPGQLSEPPDAVLDRLDTLLGAGTFPVGSLAESIGLFYRWLLADQAVIRDKHARLVPLRPNLAQRMVLASIWSQAAAGLPVRLVILKARQVGCTTLIQALNYFLGGHRLNQVARTAAHTASATADIFQIMRLLAKMDSGSKPTVLAREVLFPETDSRSKFETAGAEGLGAGGTPSFAHLSEFALWQRQEESEFTLLNSVPDVPESVVIYESTARGQDLFFDRFLTARAGEGGFCSVFIPWFADPDLAVEIDSPLDLDAEEFAIRGEGQRMGLTVTNQQLAWRRQRLATLHESIFRQEYPSTPEEAVRGREGLILPALAACVVDELDFLPDKTEPRDRVGGIDVGYADATVIVTAFERDQVVWVTNVYRRVGGLFREHAEHLQADHTYYVDPSALAGQKELGREARDLGIACRLVSAPRKKADRALDYVSAEWQTIHELCMQGRLRILESAAENLLIEASCFAWNEKTGRPDDRRSEAAGHFDCLDALKYLCMGITANHGLAVPEGIKLEFKVHTRRDAMRRL